MLLNTGNSTGETVWPMLSIIFTKLVASSQLAVCFQSGHYIKMNTFSKSSVSTPRMSGRFSKKKKSLKKDERFFEAQTEVFFVRRTPTTNQMAIHCLITVQKIIYWDSNWITVRKKQIWDGKVGEKVLQKMIRKHLGNWEEVLAPFYHLSLSDVASDAQLEELFHSL